LWLLVTSAVCWTACANQETLLYLVQARQLGIPHSDDISDSPQLIYLELTQEEHRCIGRYVRMVYEVGLITNYRFFMPAQEEADYLEPAAAEAR
jgi:hypothetical protein